jgi:hypothetical protein
MRYRIDYTEGAYEQGDLPLRKRLRHEDVRTFILYWLQGRSPLWLARQFTSQAGGLVSGKMVRRHAERLAYQGLIPERWGRSQPDWKMEATGVTEIPMTRAPTTNRSADFLPVGLRPQRGGRLLGEGRRGPRQPAGAPVAVEGGSGLVGEPGPAPRGMTWQQVRDARIARERAEAGLTQALTQETEGNDTEVNTGGEGQAGGTAQAGETAGAREPSGALQGSAGGEGGGSTLAAGDGPGGQARARAPRRRRAKGGGTPG